MKLENLPIWPRIRAAKPSTCKACRPINILRAVAAAGGLKMAGPENKTQNYSDYFSALELIELYSTGRAGLPQRITRSRQPRRPRAEEFTDLVRASRRAVADPKFRRAMLKKEAAEKRRRDVALHVANCWHNTEAALYSSKYAGLVWAKWPQENVEWDRYAKSYRFPCKYKDAGYFVDDAGILLSPTRANQVRLPRLTKSAVKRAALGEPHPRGLFALPVEGQPGVFACMAAANGDAKWHVAGFCVRGHLVPECVARGTTSLADIAAEKNAESKRIMIERFGVDRYVRESGMTAMQTDDWGTLYDLGSHRVVRLLNSTANEDGTTNEYFLAVPIGCETARAAVAWTFGLKAEEYQPAAMS